jgi:hypothetical protein
MLFRFSSHYESRHRPTKQSIYFNISNSLFHKNLKGRGSAVFYIFIFAFLIFLLAPLNSPYSQTLKTNSDSIPLAPKVYSRALSDQEIRQEIDTTLVGYWKFNEGTGTIAYDSSGYGNNGTLMNSPTWVDGLPLLGKALDFDGMDDYVDCGNGASLNVTGDITITAWVRFNAILPNQAYFISKDEGGGSKYKWCFGYAESAPSISNALVFHINYPILIHPGMWLGSSKWIPAIGQWHHVAIVGNNNTYTFYVNGLNYGDTTASSSLPSVNAPLEIGKAEAGFYFNGAIDQVKVYRRALSAEEIEDEFEAGCFIRGDVNRDGNISLLDVIYLANYVLKGGTAPIPLASGDVNCDGKYDLVDVILLARYVILGQPFPC